MTTNERLERLEKELVRTRRCNRWLLTALSIVAGICVLVGIFELKTAEGQIGGKIISANTFILEDGNGKVRALLGLDKFGPTLSMLDLNGEVRIELGMGRSGPQLALFDEDSKIRAYLNLNIGDPALTLYDKTDEIRAALGVSDHGSFMQLYDTSSRLIYKVP